MQNNNSICRMANTEDFPAVIRIWREAFHSSNEAVRFLDKFCSSASVLVAEHTDGSVVAMAHLLYGSTLTTAKGAERCPYLYAVAVDSRYRGLGYGKSIVKYAMQVAANYGFTLLATCPEDGELVSFYYKLGFTRQAKFNGDFTPGADLVPDISFTYYLMIADTLPIAG
jgi:GNAT superfamily N-acetyltransferase